MHACLIHHYLSCFDLGFILIIILFFFGFFGALDAALVGGACEQSITYTLGAGCLFVCLSIWSRVHRTDCASNDTGSRASTPSAERVGRLWVASIGPRKGREGGLVRACG